VIDTSNWWLIPGTLCTSAVFAPCLDALGVPPVKRRTIALDRPMVGDYRAQLQECVGPSDVVCGFSLGGIMAAHHADVLPADATLVLFSVTPMADDPAKADGRKWLQSSVETRGGAEAISTLAPKLFADHSGGVLDAIAGMAEASADQIAAQTQLALSRPGALAALASSRAKVLALAGGQDDQTPPPLAEKIANTAPRGTAITLPGLGHYALLENPYLCANAVRQALCEEGRVSHG
jgi:pimeloyl-ACP methyl ester carboxylesterase